jgi:Ca2+/Na+ antiporter
MSQLILIAIDLVAIGILTFGLYFPRHHRRDLVVAFLGVNVGVLAVSMILGSSTIGAGLGLGLFGVLSIIRLRSDEIAQHEVAYYFSALALGLLTGLGTEVNPLAIGLMALIIAVMFVGDHPRLFGSYRQQSIQVDTAIADEAELTERLERMLGARIRSVQVKHLDLVNDTTLVDVRFQLATSTAPARRIGAAR